MLYVQNLQNDISIIPYQIVDREEMWSNFNPIPYQIIDGEEIWSNFNPTLPGC